MMDSYLLNKRWIDTSDVGTYDKEIEEEDDTLLDKQEEFEVEYNFRNVPEQQE